jgi:NADPH:quinone reductase-like Zn-dependent oxidoreductase
MGLAVYAVHLGRGGPMKAIVQNGFGPVDALELRDVPEPVMSDDDVLIRVRAAAVGPEVWHVVTGMPYMARAIPEVRKMRRGVAGRDVAGVVQAVGSKVTGPQPGDEVMGLVYGSLAEVAVGRTDRLVAKPTRPTFEQAAAVPISGLTALQAVRDVANVRPGQSALVIGAGGGVGTYAVQIAKAFGAHVTGVCSASKAELVRSIGADDVIDYAREDFADGRRTWDAIIDTAGLRSLRTLRRALAPRGTLAIVGGDGGGRWTGGFFRQILRAPVLSLFTGQRLRPVMANENRADLQTLVDMIEAGSVTPVVGKTFALPDTAAALRDLESGHARGKLVVTVQG